MQIYKGPTHNGGLNEWRYGEGTRNPGGDYYRDGVYFEPAYWTSVEALLDYHHRIGRPLVQVVDPHLLLDDGL